jgi:hypothetical protein
MTWPGKAVGRQHLVTDSLGRNAYLGTYPQMNFLEYHPVGHSTPPALCPMEKVPGRHTMATD